MSQRRLLRLLASLALAVSAGVTSAAPSFAQAPTDPADRPAVIRPEEAEIVRLYRAVLDRNPDAGGFAFWVRLRTTGMPLRDVAAHFVGSREFELLFGAPSDGEFVDLLYDNVLERTADEGGRRYWIDRLSDGLTRIEVVLHFSESPEFVVLSGTSLPSLPPFRADVEAVAAAELGSSWRAGCPVGPESLRRIRMLHVTFDGGADTGELIVHADVVEEVVAVFERLYAARYPIERMEPVDRYGADDLASMAANNSSAFNCRLVTGGTSWSRHAFGRAVDLNPVQNPYVTATEVLPPSGSGFVDRSVHHPAVIRGGDVVTSSFAAAGWRWGGDFSGLVDWHHFDR